MLLTDVHEGLNLPGEDVQLVKSAYEYYHYGCDTVDDRLMSKYPILKYGIFPIMQLGIQPIQSCLKELPDGALSDRIELNEFLVASWEKLGWGCGYRTLQTMCSWIQQVQEKGEMASRHVPTLKDIQKSLVEMQDKGDNFIGSKQWIGSFEVCICLDFFYDFLLPNRNLNCEESLKWEHQEYMITLMIPQWNEPDELVPMSGHKLWFVTSKIVHISKGTELPGHIPQLYEHFQKFGSPVMMGGDTDNMSKGVMGVCKNPPSLLIVDPHFFGHVQSREQLQKDGWVKWMMVEDFSKDSFYNLCLPQLAAS